MSSTVENLIFSKTLLEISGHYLVIKVINNDQILLKDIKRKTPVIMNI